jgi:GntR family transcriptional regulator
MTVDTVKLQVQFASGKPVYLQVVDQVKASIASGGLRPGEALPSIRPLAEDLRVNRNTIAKAYAELEGQGVIETLAGKGCFVRAGASPLRKDARMRLLTGAVDEAAVQAHHLQIERADFLRLAGDRYDEFERQRARAAAAEQP